MAGAILLYIGVQVGGIMDALINIGLCRNTHGFVKQGDILSQMNDLMVTVYGDRVVRADSLMDLGEDTYVAHVGNIDQAKAYCLCHALEQDCVAIYDLGECKGTLIGPKAGEWGEFKPELFHIL